MATLAQAIISGSAAALRVVRQYLSNPAIIVTPTTSQGLPLPSQIVFMQVTGFQELLSNQVSKMLLVDISKGKSFLNDNIAPMPRVWKLTGYLFPAVPLIQATDQIQLEYLKETLRTASRSRQLVQFKPVVTSVTAQFSQVYDALLNQKVTGTIPVSILDITFSLDAEIQNKAPFTMTLQEMDTLSAQLNFGSGLVATPDGALNNAAAPASSNALGNTSNVVADPATYSAGAP